MRSGLRCWGAFGATVGISGVAAELYGLNYPAAVNRANNMYQSIKKTTERPNPTKPPRGSNVENPQTPNGSNGGSQNATPASGETKPLMGENPRVTNKRTNTDLSGGRATAKSIFRNQTRGQKVTEDLTPNNSVMRRAEDGTTIRLNADGSTRLDLPGRGTRPNGETIHFK
ncbi:hypothetical protein [Sneathiella sp.]|uniref:hypothetical protein n=1 Tax=Sneathiella sp. TaxID=1964365 RepID=UPI0035697615